MAVLEFKGRPLATVTLSIIMLVVLSACEQVAEDSSKAVSTSEDATVTAPGVITGNETLPFGHPPVEGIQAPAPAAEPLPAGHAAMLEGGEVDPNVRPDDEPEHPPSSGKELAVAIPDSVKGKWHSVQLEVALADGSKKEIRTILGEETELPEAGLTVQAEIFLPAYISDFETIKSASNELTNPAVKLRLLKGQKVVAVGWIFQNFSEFNSFKSDLVEFQLLSAESAEMNH